ncbi:ERI1 exoribonuclease 2 isoform X2 [Pseudophryne corroboree]|uniref:ERI1 exoribonuclease 2 isoform X2 n=1 Tax=Pseudophryne corroboree TaxID=495146 RepID=UPI003081C9DF
MLNIMVKKSQQVDDGIPLKICLSQFSNWIQKLQKEKSITFPSVLPSHSSTEQKMCGFVTWSDWDLGVCLLYECRRKQLRKPDILNSWIDLRLTYKLFYNRKPKGLNGALQDVGIEFAGREHSGLDDSRNTARLAWRMICDGCVMKITKSLDKVVPKISSERAKPVVPAQGCISGQGDVKQASTMTMVKDDHKGLFQDPASAHSYVSPGPKTVQTPPTDKQNKTGVQQQKEPSGGAHKQPQTLINGLSTTLGNRYGFSSLNSFGSLQNGVQIGAFTSTPMVHFPHSHGQVLISTTVVSVNEESTLDLASSSDLSILADWEEAAVIEDSQDQSVRSTKLEEPVLLPMDSPSASVLMLNSDQDNLNEGPPMKYVGYRPVGPQSKSVVYKSPDTTIYNVNIKKQMCNGSSFKLPSALGSKSNTTAISTGQTSKMPTLLDYFPKRKLSSVSFYSPPKKLPFTIHEDHSNRTLPVTTRCPRVVPRAVLNSTVNMNSTIKVAKMGHITAPMCNCGRRAKKCTVSTVGPNHGRGFYSCSVRKRYDENGKGCKYFKWANTVLKEKSSNSSVLLSTIEGSSFNTSHNISMGSSTSHKPFINLRPSMRT